MDSKLPTDEPESMVDWAKRMREAPYPGGTVGYLVLDFFATLSVWTALLVAPLMAWIEWRSSARLKAKGVDVS